MAPVAPVESATSGALPEALAPRIGALAGALAGGSVLLLGAADVVSGAGVLGADAAGGEVGDEDEVTLSPELLAEIEVIHREMPDMQV